MQCPRLNHFVRLNHDGTVSRCGHMNNPPRFDTLEELDSSPWLKAVISDLSQNHWPSECNRCKATEELSNTSVRLNAIEFHKNQKKKDYLIVGGVLDNLCNSACQTCTEHLSTRIGSLKGRVIRINNINHFWELPQDRITHLDINGGEPSYSPYYKEVLSKLPTNVQSIRLNTNGSVVLDELYDLVNKGIDVTVTLSFDGIGLTHDYVRWPIKWETFLKNLMTYKSMPVNLNLWTTVSALNICDLKNIFDFVNEYQLNHSWALLENPQELNIKFKNKFTTAAKEILRGHPLADALATDIDNTKDLEQFINSSDTLRKISINDYIKI